MLCTGPALHLFSATELERLVCGNPILDFAALQKSARYEGGYAADHKVHARLLHDAQLAEHRPALLSMLSRQASCVLASTQGIASILACRSYSPSLSYRCKLTATQEASETA